MSQSRSNLRGELLERRRSLVQPERGLADGRIRHAVSAYLREHYPRPPVPPVVAIYWPIEGEPDLRPLEEEWPQLALPVVVRRGDPLRFARWNADTPIRPGPFQVPSPEAPDWVDPDFIVLPCLGFHVDPRGRIFRLGYGGGYYDRTLAILHRPTLGVAYTQSRLRTFEAAPHDIALDAVVTEEGREGAAGPLREPGVR